MTTKSTSLSAKATALGLAAVLFLGNTGVAGAQTTSASLEAQINALLAQIAALQGTAPASVTFTRDLTMGSSGADVAALQNFLIKNGFPISAGATGYFGAQTKAALAAFQAAHGIAPAVGYFGPATRAKVNAVAVPNPGTPNPGTPDTGALKGGEADLNGYELKREDSAGNEGETGAEIATAEFDVDDADVRVERMDLTFEATDTGLETKPWKYFDRIAVLADGKEIAKKSVDSRSDWSKSGDGYRLSLTGMKHVVREGDTAKLTIVADIADTIDSDDLAQSFTVSVDNRGIRAVDAAGIQQYTGSSADTVEFGFDAEDNGDLKLSVSKDNPDASILVADTDKESDDYDVLAFDLKNRDDVDSLITDLSVGVSGMNVGVKASDIIRRATLTVGRDSFDGDVNDSSISFEDMDLDVDGNDDISATLSVRLARNATSTPVAFSVASADVKAEGAANGNRADISGSALGKTHTIAFAGVKLAAVSTAQSVVTPGGDAANSYGTYTVKFKVTALEDDAYIASTTADTGTVGALYTIGGDAYTGSKSAVLSSTARMENGFYLVREGNTETFTLTVTLDPSVAGIYDVRLDTIRFNDTADLSGSTTYAVPTGSDYRTDPLYIAN